MDRLEENEAPIRSTAFPCADSHSYTSVRHSSETVGAAAVRPCLHLRDPIPTFIKDDQCEDSALDGCLSLIENSSDYIPGLRARYWEPIEEDTLP